MKQKGFALIELMVVVAVLGIMAVIIIPHISTIFSTRDNAVIDEPAVTNQRIFDDLATEPISSLNLTELEFMVDYCLNHDGYYPYSPEHWFAMATIYQNQIIINELKERQA